MIFAQTTSNDLQIVNGNLVKLSQAGQVIAQKIKNRLQLVQGEWFLDTRVGTPWLRLWALKPDLELAKQILKKVILSVPGTVTLERIVCTYDGASRRLNYSFRVRISTGEVLTSSDFIVVIG